jgi:hypothetical protein
LSVVAVTAASSKGQEAVTGADVAGATVPAVLLAVTTTVSVLPLSASVTV